MDFTKYSRIYSGKSPILSLAYNHQKKLIVIGQFGSNESGSPTLSILNFQNEIKIIEKTTNYLNSVFKVCIDFKGNYAVYLIKIKDHYELVSYHLHTGKKNIVKTAKQDNQLQGFAIDPQKNLLVIPCERDDNPEKVAIEYWDIENNSLVKKNELKEKKDFISPETFLNISFSQEGEFFALGGLQEGKVFLYKTYTYEVIHELLITYEFPKQICFNHSGSLIAGVDFWQDGVFLWTVENGKRYCEEYFNANKAKATCAAFPPDEQKYIALGYSSNYTTLFDLITGYEIAEDTLHEAGITDICFTPDGKLITAGEDGVIFIRG